MNVLGRWGGCGCLLLLLGFPLSAEVWPHRLNFSETRVRSWGERRAEQILRAEDGHVWLWTPPESQRIRALLLIANNTDLVKIGEHRQIREAAARHDMAILYLQHFSGRLLESGPPSPEAEATLAELFSLAEAASGKPGFQDAAWVLLGKSSRGKFAFQPAWAFPDRVAATIAYHGETPSWPLPPWAQAAAESSILHLNVQGLTEWDGTWYRHVRPSLLNYNRFSDWRTHQVVIYGVDHGYYADYFLFPNFGQEMPRDHRLIRVTDVWNYLAVFLDTSLTLRLPAPDAADRSLRAVDTEQGYLLHPRIVEEMLGSKWFAFREDAGGRFQIIPWPDERSPVYETAQGTLPMAEWVRPAAAVPPEARGGYFWIATRNQLQAWLRLHNAYRLADRVLETLP